MIGRYLDCFSYCLLAGMQFGHCSTPREHQFLTFQMRLLVQMRRIVQYFLQRLLFLIRLAQLMSMFNQIGLHQAPLGFQCLVSEENVSKLSKCGFDFSIANNCILTSICFRSSFDSFSINVLISSPFLMASFHSVSAIRIQWMSDEATSIFSLILMSSPATNGKLH